MRCVTSIGSSAFEGCTSLSNTPAGTYTLKFHDYDDGVVTLEPTYESVGIMTYTCTACGDTYTKIIDKLVVSAAIKVDGVMARVGKEFTLTVRVENNPGIWALAFELPINPDVFEFVSADTSSSMFDQFGVCGYDEDEHTYKFNAYNSDLFNNVNGDGTLVVITLRVKEGVEPAVYSLQVKPFADNIVNVEEEEVAFYSPAFEIDVRNFKLGDVNDDGKISNTDVLRIFRYIYSSTSYPLPIFEAADVNCDGKVSNTDVLRIFRYIYSSSLYPLE